MKARFYDSPNQMMAISLIMTDWIDYAHNGMIDKVVKDVNQAERRLTIGEGWCWCKWCDDSFKLVYDDERLESGSWLLNELQLMVELRLSVSLRPPPPPPLPPAPPPPWWLIIELRYGLKWTCFNICNNNNNNKRNETHEIYDKTILEDFFIPRFPFFCSFLFWIYCCLLFYF